MLREIISNIPVNRQFTVREFQEILSRDSGSLIYESTGIDIMKNPSALTSAEIEKIIVIARQIYDKILENTTLDSDLKIFTVNFLLCKLFELWKISAIPSLFFVKIRQNFTPAQIVSALDVFMSFQVNQIWTLNFFCKHKEIFPHRERKIRTIAIYYARIYSGGVERFLSMIIPIYIQMGYRVIFFTEEYRPELEYPLPPSSELFQRVMIKSCQKIFERLNEFEKLLKKYEVDLFIGQSQTFFLIHPAFQILFLKLSGLKVGMQFHESIVLHLTLTSNMYIGYKLADFLVTLSRPFQSYWKNFGVRSYFVPNPVHIDGAENFHGRDPKKISNTILYLGRISIALDKNTFEILPILNEVVKVIPDAKLKIIGEVSNEDVFTTMKNFIAANHLENNVEFCGYHKDVEPFYESADVMLSTSLAEGWGMSITESKFYELPLVLYELPDSELLRDGKGYVSVPQGDFRAAAHAVIKILTDTEYRCKLSAEARVSLQPFIENDIAGAWKKIFDDIENNAPIIPHNAETEKIQTFMINELCKQHIQIQSLSEKLNNLMKR